MKKQLIRFWIGLVAATAINVAAQTCDSVFPGPIQNATNAGSITMNWRSEVVGASGNVIATTNYSDNTGQGASCDTGSCSASGVAAADGSYSGTYPGGSDVTTNWGDDISLSPGNYGNLYHGGNGVISMAPGVYTFSGTFSSNTFADIEISAPGTVTIFVQGNISLGFRFDFNVNNNTDRYVFLHSAATITIGNRAEIKGLVFGENVNLDFRSEVTGAVSARNNLTMANESLVTYDSAQLSTTDTNGFCNVAPPPAVSPIAEWRMEQALWSGAANEVEDSSGNDLHGRAVAVNGNFPTTSIISPIVSGDPGTCLYGEFDGTNDGYLQIDDPGTGSILDLRDNYTVMAWVYARSWPGAGLYTIVSKDENFEFHINASGQIHWWWGGGSRELNTTATVSTNAWHHIAVTFERGDQHIYLDGVSVANLNTNSRAIENDDPVFIGTDLNFNSRNFDGYIDEVRIYDETLSAAQVGVALSDTHPCTATPLIDHFEIDVGGGTASTCAAESITITAMDVSNNVIADYAETITLTTSTNNGDWADNFTNGVFVPGGSDSGSASYSFATDSSDNGVIILDISNSHAETMTITVTDALNGVSSTSGNIIFTDNIFVIDVENIQIVNRDTAVEISLMRRDSITGDCGIATAYTGNQNIKAWLIEDVADPAGAALSLNGALLPVSKPATDNVILNFASGVATTTLIDPDYVGKYQLYIEDTASTFTNGEDISSDSATLIIRPFGFYLDVISNPAATDSSGNRFTAAGQTFSVRANAVAWDAADDVNDDGIPDGFNDTNPANNADLSNNNPAQGFGNETASESINLIAYLVDPLGGVDPGLNDGPSLGDGRQLSSFVLDNSSSPPRWTALTNDVQYPEVGIVELSASILDGSYMGSIESADILGKSGYVGRFSPNHYVISPSAIDAACQAVLDYSYMNEDFFVNWQVQAFNANNFVTSNYEAGFVKLNVPGQVDFAAIDGSTTPLSARLNHSATVFSWVNGVGNLGSTLQLNRDLSPDGPYDQLNLGVTVADSDGITILPGSLNLDTNADTTNDHVNVGQTEVRFGRLVLSEAFGPETADLPVNFVTEFWTGSIWQINNDDSCTSISLAEIDYPDGSIDTPANLNVSIGSGSSTGNYGSLLGSAVNFTNGDAGHFFSAPGAGNMGEIEVNVDLNLYPWLRYDWNQDGDFSDAVLPAAKFTFGSYRGHDRVIYWQEELQ